MTIYQTFYQLAPFIEFIHDPTGIYYSSMNQVQKILICNICFLCLKQNGTSSVLLDRISVTMYAHNVISTSIQHP